MDEEAERRGRGRGGAPPSAAAAAVLPLLELPHGVLADGVLPRLQPRQRAALSLTCRALRRAVHDGVRSLALPGGACCPAVRCRLHEAFPNVEALELAPANLHEAMNVLPSLLMGAAQRLPSLRRVVLRDCLPDEPVERRKCASCNAWCNTCERARSGLFESQPYASHRGPFSLQLPASSLRGAFVGLIERLR